MNTTSNRKSRLSAWMLSAVMMLAAVLTACTKAEEELEPVVKPGDVVTDFKKVKPYGATQQFQTDLDALVTYALDIRAMRWAYFNMASKGFGSNEPFSATMDDIDNNKTCRRYAESVYNIIDAVVQNADAYEQAMQRLEDSQVLVRETPQTRGILSDAWGFMTSCKKTQTMGRKSVVTIMRELGWTSNAAKLQEVYRSLPSELRRGYSSSQDFWRDFSTGALDSRANQVFVNLYNYADPEFGDKARDLDITPGKNITVAGAELIEKGSALVIDACPISTQIGYGKDAFDAINATANLVKKGDVKGFLQNAANNLINYGRDVSKLADKMRGLDINYWDYGDQFWDYVGKDISTVLMNDVCFNEHFGESDDTGKLIPNMVKTKDRNGQEITLLIMVDSNSGKTTISCVFDKDGNIITNPDLPGKKQITVVNRHTGKRATKTITVPEKGETEVEVDLEFDEVMLEEIPEKGDLSVSPSPLTIASTGGNYKAMIVTNYLYYSCSTKDDWLKASIASDVNYLYVSASKNETGQQRRGSVTVSATDSKGKVLKSTVLTVVQEVPEVTEYWVSATPSTVQFDKDGGKQEVVVDHSNALNYVTPVIGDDLIGWCDLSWKETATGWNIVVDVDPNQTGKERAGTFIVYAASNQKDLDRAVKEGVFDKQLVAATTVMVKQSAEGGGELPNFDIKQCDVRIELHDAIVHHSNYGDYADYFGGYYDGWRHEKGYLEKLMDGKYYKDLVFHTYNIATKKSGKYYILDIDVDYEYKWKKDSKYYTQNNKGKLSIKLLPGDEKDISTYKVVSITMSTSEQDNEWGLETETLDFEVEAEIPFVKKEWDYNFKTNCYRFELTGKSITTNSFKKATTQKTQLFAGEETVDTNILQSVTPHSDNRILVQIALNE
jgi:hypothetical protein